MYEILILDGTISEEEFWNFWDQLDEVQQNNYYFYTGSYAEKGEPGICLWKLNARNERLSMLGADTQMTRPSWVTLNERGDTLYAVREQVPMGGVYEMKALRSVENPELVEPAESSELVEPAESPELLQETEGQLRGAKKEAETSRGIAKDMTAAPILQMVKEMPSGGADPCHLSLDGRENFLMAANYTSGSLAVFALVDRDIWQGRCDFGSILQEERMRHRGREIRSRAEKQRTRRKIHLKSIHCVRRARTFISQRKQESCFGALISDWIRSLAIRLIMNRRSLPIPGSACSCRMDTDRVIWHSGMRIWL